MLVIRLWTVLLWWWQVDHIKVQVDTVIEPIIEKAEELEKEIREKETKPNAVPDQAN